MKKATLNKKPPQKRFLQSLSVFLLTLLVNFGMQAQALPTFVLTVTPTAETCTNNGVLTFSTSGADPLATITYNVYKAPDFSSAVAITVNSAVSGLGSGTYRVVATQSRVGFTSNSQVWNGTINNNVTPLTFTASKTDVTCPSNGTINVTINTGTAAVSNAYKITGPMNVGPQSSGSFTGLVGGTYIVSVTDICGEVVTQNVNIATFTPNVVLSTGTDGGVSSYNSSRSICGYADFRQFLNAGGGNNVMVYPLTIEYTVHPPGGAPDIVTTKNITGSNHYNTDIEDVTNSIPFYTTPFTLDIKVTDFCGNAYTATRNINLTATVDSAIFPAGCSGSYFSVNGVYMVSPLTYEVLSAPPGYIIGPPSSTNVFGGPGNPVPDGSYTVRTTDNCGVFIDKVINVSAPSPFVWTFQAVGCGDGNGSFSITQPNSTYYFASASVTAGPAGFSGVYPVDATSRITADGYNVLFYDVPGGTYTVETRDQCNNLITTNITVTAYDNGTVVASEVRACGSFDVNLNVTGDNLSGSQTPSYWLQIKDPITGNWGHPINGNYNTDIPNAANAQSLTNNLQQGSWTIGGTYRIVKTFKTLLLSPGVAIWNYGRDCSEVLHSFDYVPGSLRVKDLYSFNCADGIHYNATLIGYDGVAPFTYGITTKDGASFVVNNGTNNLFTGLTSGVYNFTVTDACNNVVNSLVDIAKLGLPKITAVNICDGSTTGELSVEGVPYLNFSWTKGNDPTVLSTTSTLAFPLFNTATDVGTYHVRLTSNDPGSCLDVVLDYIITSTNISNPNSGADSTTSVCRSVVTLDLNTLLPPTADPYGTWVETTNPSSGNINGNLWFPSVSAAGTFTFTYTVNGSCSGSSTSTYAVVNTDTPAAPTASVTSQPTCTVGTGTVTVTVPAVAPGITYTLTGTNPVRAAVTNTDGIFSLLDPGDYDVTASAATCKSTGTSLTVNAQPATPAQPTLGAVTQPTTCAAPNGTFQIQNYDAATYNYVFTPSVISISATGLVTASTGNYTVTITDIVSGCTSAASNSVTVNPGPVAPAAPVLGTVTQPTTCAAPNGTFQITNYDAATYNYVFTPSVISISATGLVTASAGNYTVTITDIVSGCTSAASNSVTVNPAPAAPAAPVLGTVTQPTTCAAPNGTFQIANYDAATYTYVFTPAVISISATGLVTASAGNYTVTITDIVSGCTSAASNSVTVTAPVAPAAPVLGTVTQPTTCAAPNGTFQIANYDAATYTYVFTPAVISISATGLVTASAGNYTVVITDIVSGCTSAPSNSVTVNPAPAVPATPVLGTVTQPTTCAVPNGTFQITNYDAATYTYVFTPAVISISATGLVTASAGNYTVTITDIVSGCASAASNSVIVNPAPVAPATPVLGTVTQPTTCAVPNGTFQITNYDAATYTYVFTPAVISISATGLVTASAGNYTVTITNIVSGCASAASNSVTVNPAPVAPAAPVLGTVTQPTTCAAPNGTFQITNYDAATYAYVFTPAVISISATGLVTASAGDYTVTITDIVSGCSSADSNSVTVNLAPVAPAAPVLGTVTQPTCSTATGSFVITNYDLTMTYIFTPSIGVTISSTGVVIAPSGTYTVMAKNLTSGCTSAASSAVLIQSVICAKTDDYTTTPINGMNGGTTTSVLANDTLNGVILTPSDVNLTEVTVPTGLTLNANGTITVAAGTIAGTYTLIYRICEKLNPTNCDDATVSVTVTAAPIVANDDSGSSVNGIIGGTSFTNVLVNDTLNGLPVVATNVNTTFVSSTNAGVTLSGTDVVVAAGTPAGSYTLTYRICEKLNPSNCDDATVSVTVVVANNPSIALVKTVVFNDENNDGYAQVGETITYNFTVTNTGDTALDKINVTDPLPGINLKGGPISLSAGQSDSSSFIGVYTLTQADINLGSISNQAKATGTDPNETIVSDLSNDTSAIGDNPTVLPIIGCVIEVFNALSPNGDGENDVLRIRGIECYPDNTVEIYNRWGVLVYERDHYNNTDGAFKGISEGRVTVNQSEELPVGTYYYVIKYSDSNSATYKKSGYLYINRK